jgi:hypothetical protein
MVEHSDHMEGSLNGARASKNLIGGIIAVRIVHAQTLHKAILQVFARKDDSRAH